MNTNVGLVREENQDRMVAVRYQATSLEKSFFLLGIADGIGGLKNGAECASQALAALVVSILGQPDLPESGRLRNAILDANTAVHDIYKERGGTTLVGVLVTKDAVAATSVGDSRLYCFSRNALEQISEDDSIGAELGRIRPDLNRSLDIGGFAHHLTQYVGMGRGLEPHVYDQFPDGNSFLLATDGVDRLPHSVLLDLISTARGSFELSTRLIQIANWTGGKDNASAIILSTPSTRRNSDLVLVAEEASLELWDCFGKYEILFEPTELQPQLPASQDSPPMEPEQRWPTLISKLGAKRKRPKRAPRGDVQISLVDENGKEVVQAGDKIARGGTPDSHYPQKVNGEIPINSPQTVPKGDLSHRVFGPPQKDGLDKSEIGGQTKSS